MGWLVAAAAAAILVMAAQAIKRRKQRRADFAAEKAILAATTSPPQEHTAAANPWATPADRSDGGTPAGGTLPARVPMAITVTALTSWAEFQRPVLQGTTFPDGSVAVLTVTEGDGGAKAPKMRLSREAQITAEGREYDRCCVGLLRLAGVTAPVRLPHTIAYDTSGKASRPVAKVTAEAVITYADRHGEHSSRRITILGFEPIGTGRVTDEVVLHAWCWTASDYRTFLLSRVASMLDALSGEARDPVRWVWAQAGIKFKPGAKLGGG